MTKKSSEKDQFSDKPANVSKTTRDVIKGESKLKSCFVITPIGEDNSSIRIKADGLVDTVIIPALGPTFEVLPAHRLTSSGSISVDIINRILDADLVIANLTGLNPNVMYELALRHAAAKPVIIMAEYETKLPFDISDQKTIFYSDHIADVNPTKLKLKKMAEQALGQEDVKNPVTIARKNSILMNSPNVPDADKSILQTLQELKDAIADGGFKLFKNERVDLARFADDRLRFTNERVDLARFAKPEKKISNSKKPTNPKRLVFHDKKDLDIGKIYRTFVKTTGNTSHATLGSNDIYFQRGLSSLDEIVLDEILEDINVDYSIEEEKN